MIPRETRLGADCFMVSFLPPPYTSGCNQSFEIRRKFVLFPIWQYVVFFENFLFARLYVFSFPSRLDHSYFYHVVVEELLLIV
jgi:hypothetical protein